MQAMNGVRDALRSYATRPHIALLDRTFGIAVYAAAVIFVMLVLGLFAMLVHGSWESLRASGLRFFISTAWNPVTSTFGALPFVYGTVVSSLLALLIAGSLGVLGAVYLAEFAPRAIGTPLSFLIEMLAAVPSVVFGLWGLFVLAPFLRTYVAPPLQAHLGWLPIFSGPYYGVGLFTAGILLSIMILPTVAAITRDLIRAVPKEMREGSYALGATRWETVRRVVLPAARAGIFGACVLALGRALGETIAVTMVIGNRPAIAASLFAPSYTLSSVVANEFTEATTSLYLSALVELGLLLFVISVVVNGLARVLMWTLLRPGRG